MGRAVRVILPLASGIIAHLFVVYGYQGSSDDTRNLSLTNKLLEAVIGEAKACGTGQPVIIAGDLNSDPSVIPVTAKAMQCSDLVDLDTAFTSGRGVAPAPTCRFDLDGAPGTPLLPALIAGSWWIVGSDLTLRSVLILVWGLGLLRFRLSGLFLHLLLLAGWITLTGPGILLRSLFWKFGGFIWICCSMFLLM